MFNKGVIFGTRTESRGAIPPTAHSPTEKTARWSGKNPLIAIASVSPAASSLQVGYSGLLGIGTTSLWAGRASAAIIGATPEECEFRRLDLLDRRPEPSRHIRPEARGALEIRGEFKSIATTAPGVAFCEHLPQLAARADKLAVIRSMTHGLPSHEHATHMMLTGINELPPGSTHMASRADWPCYASGLDFVHPRSDGVPNGVHLPTYLNNGYGFSGQNAGVLGPKFDPWHIKADPNDPGFRVEELTLPAGLTAEKVGNRRALLAEFDRQADALRKPGNRPGLQRHSR